MKLTKYDVLQYRNLQTTPLEFKLTSENVQHNQTVIITCMYPPSQWLALSKLPTLNLLNLMRSIQSLGVPLNDLNRYQHVIGLPTLSCVTSGLDTSSYMSTVLLQ